MANEGSSPAACNATTAIEVVEVFPCVPASRSWVEPSISSASRSERRSSGMPSRLARTSSGLSCGMAAKLVTTAVGS